MNRPKKKRKMVPIYDPADILAERFAERLAGTADIEIVVTHTARQYWNE